jgi:hypothetical protein
MKLFNIGTNNYYHTANVSLDEVPFTLYYLGEMIMWICSAIPSIPLPKWYYRSEDGPTTLKEWFGDTQQLFHIYICTPITSFVWRHTKNTTIYLPYHYLQELFPDYFERGYDDDDEDKQYKELSGELSILHSYTFKQLQKKMNWEFIKKICDRQVSQRHLKF